MWFTNLTDPTTVAALLIEAVLFCLAFITAVFGVLVSPARWIARGMAAFGVLVGMIGEAEVLWEIWLISTGTYPLNPLTQPNGPPNLWDLVVTQLVLVVAGILAFRRPGLAGLLFVAYALNSLRTVLGPVDPTSLPGYQNSVLVVDTLPSLTVGALLVATWWAAHRGPRRKYSSKTPSTSPASP